MRWTFAPGTARSQVHWDIAAQVGQIEDNSDDRGATSGSRSSTVRGGANGWVRPWSIIREKGAESEEDKAENRFSGG